ncbi:MAG: ABC transporter substrate-binding protein [Rhizobiales bacterium]|nr:ABC transporter substrate-binding protein [Hyphomicrobiales bacterium]
MLVASLGPWRHVAAFAGAVVLCLTVQTAHAQTKIDAATTMIEHVGQEFLDVLGPGSEKDERQLQRLIGLLEEAINLDTTGKLILAKNWRNASDDQRAAYLNLFRPYALDTLASKIRASSTEIPLESFKIIKGRAGRQGRCPGLDRPVLAGLSALPPGLAPAQP